MKIAQIAPLWECVPPPAYGGTELIISLLTNELVHRGHDVTLFGTGDSKTLAKLVPGCGQALRPQGVFPTQYMVYEQVQLQNVFNRAHEFDLIHCHVDFPALPYAGICKTPVLHTLHGVLSPTTEHLFIQHAYQNYVSISESQRREDLDLNYRATIYNAIAVDQFKFFATPDTPPYLAFLGRMSVEKGPHLAIEIAKRVGLPLKMAGKVDLSNRAFFKSEVLPHIDGQHIQFLGEADQVMKNNLMGRAIATLFPITWDEPFGLVMPESMASGTPVIAMEMGSTPKVIVNGLTGFLCQTVDDCVEAVQRVSDLDRDACRHHVTSTFSIERMVDSYESLYSELLEKTQRQPAYSDFLLAS